jgi:YesN/AraC family two-component response regulator
MNHKPVTHEQLSNALARVNARITRLANNHSTDAFLEYHRWLSAENHLMQARRTLYNRQEHNVPLNAMINWLDSKETETIRQLQEIEGVSQPDAEYWQFLLGQKVAYAITIYHIKEQLQ